MTHSFRLAFAAGILGLSFNLVRCGTENDKATGEADANASTTTTTEAVTTTTEATATTTTLAGVTTTTLPAADCPASALAAFTANIAPVIDSTCSGCHSSNPTRTLTAGQDAANRTSLLGFTGTNAQTLKDKIHSNSHGGGNHVSALPSAKIDAWIAAEVICAQ